VYNISDKQRGGEEMNIDTKKIVSISEANQNFSRVAKMVEMHGELYIFKNNKPKYKLVDIENDNAIEMTDDEKIDFVAARILKLYRPAFEELAK
jgi:antitoxin Phd